MAHAFYQLTQVRSSIRAEGVARMAKVMKVDSCQPGCRDGREPDAPAEVAVMKRLATRAGEDQIAIAGRGELIQVTNDVGGTMVAGMITVRRHALDFGGPKSSPPPGSGVSDRSILTVHAARSRSSRRNADSSTRQPERFTVSFTAPGTIDCGTFEDQFTDFFDGAGATYFDSAGNPIRIVVRWEHHSNGTNSATGLTLHEHGHFTETIDLLTGTDTITGNEEIMNRPGSGVVVQDVGKVVIDAGGNVVFFAGGHKHSEVLPGDQLLCEALG